MENKLYYGTSSGWVKYSGNPVLGGELGVCFDIAVVEKDSRFLMFFSWRTKKSIAVVNSNDGAHWDDPRICIGPDLSTGWEEEVNRPCVVLREDGYHMWYTGQTFREKNKGRSAIGYAFSKDGTAWERKPLPVLTAELPWEKNSVMCPHVLWDREENQYKMWYSGGEQYEPDSIGYAISKDGIFWEKLPQNPVFVPDPRFSWEQAKVTACQVIKEKNGYLMFYIGFQNEDRAHIGAARSEDGVTGWKRFEGNPIIAPDPDGWDSDACYKPFAVKREGRWLLWYNGRRKFVEQIGLATCREEDFRF